MALGIMEVIRPAGSSSPSASAWSIGKSLPRFGKGTMTGALHAAIGRAEAGSSVVVRGKAFTYMTDGGFSRPNPAIPD